MPKDNQAVFLKSLPKNIAQVVTDVNEVMAALEHGQTLAENNQANKIGSQDRFLQILTDAEALGENIHKVKQLVCEANGWSFEMFDATSNAMIKVAGDKAPNVVKVNFSVGISAFKKGFTFKEFGSWKELREAIKDPDQLESLKEAEKDLNKTLKGASQQDIATATATIQKLVENLSK
jgi:cell fate (sporulation/competence/biofilm development) regulator YlbF (YheA/YmcA/DUF963 family)